ncbi:T-lymphocyte surface antigen Ly-9-like [Trachemys scripta elegans]|uniref:T-lymphocyte surface antigen Ly-9-like n=1 Tax=Trachemys scripta elegans TaxID=31138 RepID=UPI001556F800|nr:T-lymphocyte surface antigen Ly-9-like [Trachemys scripta elegans]
MEGARRPSLLMLLLVLQPGGFGRAEADAMELSGILGGSVTFPLEIPAAEQFENAVWTINTNSLVTVTPGKPPNVVLIDKTNYRGRLGILDESYSLQLTRLRMEDTGQYRAAVNTDKGSVTKRFTLRVYKPVPEPTVVCDPVTCVSETCNYNLSCTVRDGGDNVTYSWTHTAGGAVVPNESILHISLSPRDAHLNVTCTAQNPASNSSTTASAKNLCAGYVGAEAGAMELSRILGDSVTFPLGIPAEQVRTAAWTVNATRTIVTVAAGNPPTVIVTDPSYEGRLRVPESNSLQITSLRMEDTGTYSAQISTATGAIHRHFTLRVYKPVPEPTVLCDSVTCVSETCNYNLSCTARDGGEHVTYSWTHTAGGAVVANESILHISLSPRDAHLAVTCTAQNPASNSSTTASAKDLCAAPTPVSASSLSYCHVKGIVLLLVLGALSTGIIAVHVLPGRERRRD